MIDPAVHERTSRRAIVARQLLGIHESDELESIDTWSWSLMGELPHWFLVDAEGRERRQLISGALMQGPSLKYWVHRAAVLEAHRLIGAELFEAIVNDAARMDVSALDASFTASAVPVDGESVQERLRQSGAGVLLASIDPALLNESLLEAIGPAAGDIPPQAARLLLLQVERRLQPVQGIQSLDAAAWPTGADSSSEPDGESHAEVISAATDDTPISGGVFAEEEQSNSGPMNPDNAT